MARKKTIGLDELLTVLARALELADEPMPEIDVSLDGLSLLEDEVLGPIMPLEATRTGPGAIPGDDDTSPISGTQRISIRVPKRVLRAFRSRARKTGVPYQTLMNRALRVEADRMGTAGA